MMREAKSQTIDVRQVVYHFRSDKEKEWKKQALDLQVKCDKLARTKQRLQTKDIPNLENQLARNKYKAHTAKNRHLLTELDTVID